MKKLLIVALVITSTLIAQGPGGRGGPDHGGPGPGDHHGRGGPGGPARPDGKWWANPFWIQRLDLTTDQRKRLEDVFQQSRMKLIDLTAALEKQEATLDPLLNDEHPQETRVLSQIDAVAQARAELEKANARMLWGFRTVLTTAQWKNLQGDPDEGRFRR